jgi:hypothetical protein
MVVDLNTILLYCDRSGVLHDVPARRYFSLLDGIVAGAGEGPMNPLPVDCGVLLAGFNPLSVDWMAAELMGFSPSSLKVLTGARQRPRPLGPDALPVLVTDDPAWSHGVTPDNDLRLEPHSRWTGIQHVRGEPAVRPAVPPTASSGTAE